MHSLRPTLIYGPSDTIFKPRLVITKGSEVAAHYEWTDQCQAHLFARDLAVHATQSVCIYEVDWRLSLPPPPGNSVNAEECDWVLISYRRPAVRCAKAPLRTRIAQPAGDQ